MDKPKWTPGPWRTAMHEDSWYAGPAIVEGDNPEADARLIAAAPALANLAEHIEAMTGDPYLEGHPEWNAIADEARGLFMVIRGDRVVGEGGDS